MIISVISLFDTMIEYVIEHVDSFSRHPLVITTIGGLVIKIILDKRSDRIRKQSEGVSFVSDNATLINKIFPLIFEWIRTHRVEDEDTVRKEIRILFENRFSVRVKSRVLFGESDFATKYDIFCWQLHALVEVLKEASNPAITDTKAKMPTKLVELVVQKQQSLSQRWPLGRDAFHKIELTDIANIDGWDQAHSWAMSLWFRGLSLHMKALKRFVK